MADNSDPIKKQRTEKSSKLLTRVIEVMFEQLNQKPCEHCGSRGVSASDVMNVTRFLKDNGFSVDKEDNEDFLDRLKRERQEREASSSGNVQSRPS